MSTERQSSKPYFRAFFVLVTSVTFSSNLSNLSKKYKEPPKNEKNKRIKNPIISKKKSN